MRRETKSLVAMSLLPSPSLTSRTTSRSAGVSDAQPLVGRLRWPRPRCALATASSVDRAAPSAQADVEVLLAQRIPNHRDRGLVTGVPDFEAGLADGLPEGVCGTEEPGRFAGAAGVTGEISEALQSVGNTHARLDVAATNEGVVDVPVSLVGVTLCSGDAGPRGQSQHSIPARRR